MPQHDPRLDSGRAALIAQLDERDAVEARQDAKVLRPGPAVLPDCMIPDGGNPCWGYTRLREVIDGQGLSMQEMGKELDEARAAANVARAKISELGVKLNEARTEIEGERQARHRCEDVLRAKDAAMGVLFDRMKAAGVDFSDLIS